MSPCLIDTPVLETRRLTLRPVGPQDLDPAIAFLTTDRARYVGGGADKPVGHAWRICAILIGHWALRGNGPFAMVDKSNGQTIGSAGPFYPAGRPEPELSWTIWSRAAEGQGFAFEAVTAIRAHVFRDLRWRTAVSYIDPTNTRSVALAERLGARLDLDAAREDPEDLVYRHPNPGA
ncbi:MAG: GNAT family N-acetyltransferase, partial [Pseudomonadota bacterium]